MKLLFLGNFSDRKHEGLVTISKKVKAYFEKKLDLDINTFKNLNSRDVVCYHSSGFIEALNFSKLKTNKPKIYSLHSNVIPIYNKVFLDFYQDRKFLFDSKADHLTSLERLKKTIFYIISHNTPLFIKRNILKRCDLVIVPNFWLKKKLALKNSVVIKHGIDTNKFKPAKLGKNKKIIVSYFGHPTSDKGTIDVLNVFKQLDPNKFSKRFYFTSLNKNILKTVKKIDLSVEIFGSVENIVEEYSRADIILLPYRHSSGAIATPLVLIEAMACETAVITTNLPHQKEICSNTVEYVKPYDVNSMVIKVKKLAKDPKRRKELGKSARKQIVKNYNLDDMFKSYEKLFSKYK